MCVRACEFWRLLSVHDYMMAYPISPLSASFLQSTIQKRFYFTFTKRGRCSMLYCDTSVVVMIEAGLYCMCCFHIMSVLSLV